MDPQGLTVNDTATHIQVPLCQADHSQLVVIDLQTKLGAAMPTKVLNRVVQNTALLLKAAGLLGIPVLATEQYPAGLGPLEPTISECLPQSTPRLEKSCFSCVDANGFVAKIQENHRQQVIVTGMEAHVCVLQTAIDLHHHGLKVFVVEDAICSRKLENYQNALVRMHQARIMLVSAESVIFEWLGDANHEHFKTIVTMLC